MNSKSHILGRRHLLNCNRNGIELQAYAAIVARLLLTLWTGRRPTLRTFEMLCWHLTGMADEEELPPRIGRLQKNELTGPAPLPVGEPWGHPYRVPVKWSFPL